MLRLLYLFFAVLFILIMSGCSATIPAPVKVEIPKHKIDYISDIKPILDKRCVTCHSCYNSPCQAKFSSFEGVDRGGSKALVYNATRLNAIDPTRLFVDAQNTRQWREKGFFSLTKRYDTNTSYNDSIMIHMLHDKMEHPEIVGEYAPETDTLICPRNREEMGQYLEEKPYHGMPYGFPALQQTEYKTLAQWLQQGAQGPSSQQQKILTTPGSAAAKEINKWESFLNTPDAKHAMTARYLYEHYFLAHLNFTAAPSEFYEIVRSKTAAPQAVELIPTLRPFDSPGTEPFYYRFRRIHSTIVHKTHMVVELNDAELARVNELFIQPKWTEEPHLVGYNTKISANPFVAFFQIPVRSRYQFMLDHNNYIVMTFIRGPVCRGQMALNVIHDHFWVMFQDPDYDLSIQQPGFLLRQADNLSLPIETVDKSILETFSDAYRERYRAYYKAKEALYDRTYPEGLGLKGIWKGERAKDAPLLTVYRHFDSASVHRGVIGELPRTVWVIDYPQFERIYYTLVAGYDVFGNLSHQTNIRRYMDFLRTEGEINFLAYMPPEKRLQMYKSWYIGDSEIQEKNSIDNIKRGTKVVYKTADPKSEFIEQVVNGHILKSTGIGFDDFNYYAAGESPPMMPKTFHSVEDVRNGARALTAPGTGFIRHVIDYGANLIHLRVILPDGKSKVFSLVINRWHDNVNSLFSEEDRLDSAKDTLDIIQGSVGSYPNAFAVVHYKELPDFFDLMDNFEKNERDENRFKRYFISRSADNFWETFDWFQDHFNKADPIQSGLYDLNRYFRKAW